MNGLLLNLLLAIVWAALTGVFSAANLAFGFALGFLVLFFTRRVCGVPRYVEKVQQVMSLALYFLWELVVANLRVAYDVLTPRQYARPGVVAIPLDARTDTEITLLANLITLTPGTLSIDVSHDRKELYVHALYIDDPDEVRRQIKQGFERRVLEIMR
jgi:multicomponent Na+:H+ antiporter subunit E